MPLKCCQCVGWTRAEGRSCLPPATSSSGDILYEYADEAMSGFKAKKINEAFDNIVEVLGRGPGSEGRGGHSSIHTASWLASYCLLFQGTSSKELARFLRLTFS